jgi:hypothetical protein
MALLAKDNGNKNFKQVPAGIHIARCYMFADMGEQITDYSAGQHKVRIQWELLGTEPDGTPMTILIDGVEKQMTIGKTYTLSLAETSALRKDLESWRGIPFTPSQLDGFEVKKIVGAYCMLKIEHSNKEGRTYVNVTGVKPVSPEFRNEKPEPVNDVIYFDMTEPDWDAFNALPDWIKENVKKSPQFAELQSSNVNYDDMEIPF